MPPTKRLTREQQKAQTRERLMQAAKKVFAKMGYSNASIDSIAEEAGFTVGAVYSNFESKESLFAELFERHTRERLQATRELVEAAEAVPETRIREAIRSLLEHATEDRDLWLLYLEFWRSSLTDSKLRKRFISYNREVLANITELLGSQFQALAIDSHTPPEQVAIAMTMLIDGFMLYRLIDHPDYDDELFEQAVSKLIASLIMTPAATLLDETASI